MSTRSSTALAAAAAVSVVAALGAGGGTASAAEAKDVLLLTALTGPKGGDVTITVPASQGGAEVDRFEHVHVRLVAPAGSGRPNRILNREVVAAKDGVGKLALGTVERGTRVEVQVQVRESEPPGTAILRGDGIAKLRPDLVVAAVRAPAQTLSTRPVDVIADVTEQNGETGAEAMLTLTLGPTPLAEPKTVTVGADGTKTVTFEGVKLETAMSAELTVRVADAAPFETDATNNARTRTVEVTEHELVRSNVLVPSLGGYGAQFNNHVYAPITPWPRDAEPADDYDDFEEKVVALQPHLVRIFYNDRWDGNADGAFPDWQKNYASFVESVRLAQDAGATIDISFQNLGIARSSPGPAMAKFADVLQDLIVNHGLRNVRWAEVGNEPNSGGTGNVSLAEFEALVRALDTELKARGLDDHLGMMGPGLVENAGVPTRTHYVWAQAIARTMGDLFDAWGEHVYWFHNDAGRLEYRLRDTWRLMNEVLPQEQRKPIYMMEFGIRGLDTCPGKPFSRNTWYESESGCTEIWRTRIAGFQQFWFAIGSAQLGFTGAAKWDAYWGVYDRTLVPPQVYWMVGPVAEGSPLTPSYYAMALVFHTTVPGWQVVRVDPWDETDWSVKTYGIEGHSSNDTPEKELAAYAGPSGELTILGLDTNGRALNAVSADPPAQYSLGGLPANTNFTLVVWNKSGDGTNSVEGTVPTNAAGVARFAVPLQAAFSLTTLPVSS